MIPNGTYYKLKLTPKKVGYIYVLLKDNLGKIKFLFPTRDFDGQSPDSTNKNPNPVNVNKEYNIPGQDSSFRLKQDESAGISSFYIAFSKKANNILEKGVITQKQLESIFCKRACSDNFAFERIDFYHN